MKSRFPERIDLHMHSTASDGTDSARQLLEKVRLAGLDLFSVTDHDTIMSCEELLSIRKEEDPDFLTGIEISCKDKNGKYHILGYDYDSTAQSIQGLAKKLHQIRMKKFAGRLDYLEQEHHMPFSEEDKRLLLNRPNPGKPHLANLMIRYGYVADKKEAFDRYLNLQRFPDQVVDPGEAITAIREAGGVPVLAHPSFGSGKERIVGADMEKRLHILIDYGLEGVEAYYSGFSPDLQEEMLRFARQFHLYITAGSDYHGANKTVQLGQTNLNRVSEGAPGLQRFLERIGR